MDPTCGLNVEKKNLLPLLGLIPRISQPNHCTDYAIPVPNHFGVNMEILIHI